MIKHKIIGIAVFLILICIPVALYASMSLNGSFSLGGRVTAGPSTLQSAVTCAASYGPFMMQTFTRGPTGSYYFIRAVTRGTPHPGGYLLGLYQLVPDLGTCVNSESGTPIPAYEIRTYGVSKR